jgi:hypothetical protein
MIPKPIKVRSLKKYKLELTYSDGTTGIVDLSHLANKGVFSIWEKDDVFDKVYIDDETNAIAWNDEADVCPDALFFKLKNRAFEEWKETQLAHAHD